MVIDAYQFINGMEAVPWESFRELTPKKATGGHRYIESI